MKIDCRAKKHGLPQSGRSILQGLFLLLIFALLPYSSRAAELNISANQLPVTLGPYLDYYEDSGRELSIEDILTGDIEWQRSTQEIPTLGMSNSAHWFSIVLSGEDLSALDLILVLDTPVLDEIEFFFIQNNRILSSARAGDSVPFSEQLYPFRIPVVPLDIPSDGSETSIYLRAVSSTGVEIPLSLSSFSLLASNQQPIMIFYGGLMSSFLLCFFVCIILYLFTKQPQFQGIALFFAGVIPFSLTQTGLGKLWFWGESVELNTRLSLVSACVLLISLCVLGRSMKFESPYRDSANTALHFLFYAMFPVAAYYSLIPYEYLTAESIRVLMILGLLAAMGILGMAGITAIQGSKSALYLFLSWILIILAYVSLLSYKFMLVERAASIQIIAESITVVAALCLLLSVAEFVKARNDELSEARLETKAKGDFLRNVSREFLTPVHLILANSKRLLAVRSEAMDEAAKQHMSTVIHQSDHLHKLINDLLEMAELESDDFEPEFELVEMSAFLTEIKKLMSPSAMEKGLELSSKFATANLLVQTDKARLQHVLVNIITNAIKYTEKGNILLAYKAVYFRRRLGIEISIEDTGHGMSKEFQQRLFQEFSQEEDYSEKEPQGTGLGLVIVKRMLEKLGGEISFESQKNTGSKFFIKLPLRAQKD